MVGSVLRRVLRWDPSYGLNTFLKERADTEVKVLRNKGRAAVCECFLEIIAPKPLCGDW